MDRWPDSSNDWPIRGECWFGAQEAADLGAYSDPVCPLGNGQTCELKVLCH